MEQRKRGLRVLDISQRNLRIMTNGFGKQTNGSMDPIEMDVNHLLILKNTLK